VAFVVAETTTLFARWSVVPLAEPTIAVATVPPSTSAATTAVRRERRPTERPGRVSSAMASPPRAADVGSTAERRAWIAPRSRSKRQVGTRASTPRGRRPQTGRGSMRVGRTGVGLSDRRSGRGARVGSLFEVGSRFTRQLPGRVGLVAGSRRKAGLVRVPRSPPTGRRRQRTSWGAGPWVAGSRFQSSCRHHPFPRQMRRSTENTTIR
jgi:hypothetical protein